MTADARPRHRLRASDLALTQGIADTKGTLAEWRRRPRRVLGPWFAASLLISVGLLAAVTIVGTLRTPDPAAHVLPGVMTPVDLRDVAYVITRNLLVLALHSLACVAGFIAGSTMPLEAQEKGGWWGAVHDYAGRFAIIFVSTATTFSLLTQALLVGELSADTAAALGIAPIELTVLLLPHALPELVGLFLPLAAWLLASRRGQWHQLLAATFVTTAIALPLVIASAFIEVYVTPDLIRSFVAW